MVQFIKSLKKADPFVYGIVVVMTLLIILAGIVVMFISLAGSDLLFVVFILTPFAVALACLGLWTYYILTGYFYMSAYYKGFSDPMYLRFCFFFGALGGILVCSLPYAPGKEGDFIKEYNDDTTEYDDDHEDGYMSGATLSQSVKKAFNSVWSGNFSNQTESEAGSKENTQESKYSLYTPNPCPQPINTDDQRNSFCPCCETKVSVNAISCPVCGQVFANSITNVPYWCKECGQEGPYLGPCPNCKSTVKFRNPFYVR